MKHVPHTLTDPDSHAILGSAWLGILPLLQLDDNSVVSGFRVLSRQHAIDALGCQRKLVFKQQDRKSTRLNSSHSQISYAVFCLKKKKEQHHRSLTNI